MDKCKWIFWFYVSLKYHILCYSKCWTFILKIKSKQVPSVWKNMIGDAHIFSTLLEKYYIVYILIYNCDNFRLSAKLCSNNFLVPFVIYPEFSCKYVISLRNVAKDIVICSSLRLWIVLVCLFYYKIELPCFSLCFISLLNKVSTPYIFPPSLVRKVTRIIFTR